MGLGYYSFLRFFSGFFSSSGGGGVSCVVGFSSVAFCSVSISLVISSIGFGGGVVAIVQPIHAPMPIMAMNAIRTGIAITQNCVFDNHVTCTPNMLSHCG